MNRDGQARSYHFYTRPCRPPHDSHAVSGHPGLNPFHSQFLACLAFPSLPLIPVSTPIPPLCRSLLPPAPSLFTPWPPPVQLFATPLEDGIVPSYTSKIL